MLFFMILWILVVLDMSWYEQMEDQLLYSRKMVVIIYFVYLNILSWQLWNESYIAKSFHCVYLMSRCWTTDEWTGDGIIADVER